MDNNIVASMKNKSEEAQLWTAEKYLERSFAIPDALPSLPLEDEEFVAQWEDVSATGLLTFLQKLLPTGQKPVWENEAAFQLELKQTMGGRLPVITVDSHSDFCRMTGLLYAQEGPAKFPVTVNAVTLKMRRGKLAGQRLIILNRSPYSNIPADRLQLAPEDWLDRSQRLRLRHECAHYECLRLLGQMQNHLLDELVADGMGQLAAFGSFSAVRQRLFFGLSKGSSVCTGRLTQYTRYVKPEQREEIYAYANEAVEKVEAMLHNLQGATEQEIFLALCSKQWLQ